MGMKSKTVLLVIVAALVLVWGLGMKDSDDGGGYSDETTYFSAEEVEARQKVIDEMAKMRGETPKPTATPKPEKEEEQLDERFSHIQLQETPQSFTLSRIGYDSETGTLVAEYNMTGLIYAYFDVPAEEYERLMAAEGFDKWFEAMIQSKYKFEQLN